MARLDTERQSKLEPTRLLFAKKEIEKLGYDITSESDTKLVFSFMGHPVNFFPYSGWHTGASIKDGRGIQKLLNQIKPK